MQDTMKQAGRFNKFMHRRFGKTSKEADGFFEREAIDEFGFNKGFRSEPSAPVASTQFEEYLAWHRNKYNTLAEQAFLRADNFLLLVNSGALAGAITLAARGDGDIDLLFGASILLFFVSIGMLGMSKWCLVVHTHFVRGEFYKNYIRYRAQKISELDLIKADYRANGNPTFSGVFAALSFATFIIGWILLVAPILSPHGIVSKIAQQTIAQQAESQGITNKEISARNSNNATEVSRDDTPP
jgi:hypothetical protein